MKELHAIINKDGFAHIVDENNQYYEPGIIRNDRYIEKKQLISFLEDKIKKIDNEIKIKQLTQQGEPNLLQEISELRIISLTFQEVLDFVKGGKE